jgi:hypothetical protein
LIDPTEVLLVDGMDRALCCDGLGGVRAAVRRSTTLHGNRVRLGVLVAPIVVQTLPPSRRRP